MHFQSPKAYKYFVDCKDNHKAWQSFEILLHGIILEVLELYRNSACETPSVLGILNFISETENATLSLISEIFLSFGLAIYIQRIGDRNKTFSATDITGKCQGGDFILISR